MKERIVVAIKYSDVEAPENLDLHRPWEWPDIQPCTGAS